MMTNGRETGGGRDGREMKREMIDRSICSPSDSPLPLPTSYLPPFIHPTHQMKRNRSEASPPICTVAIIGSAGRNEDGAKMNATVFDAMTAAALRTITDHWHLSPQNVRLVSGGAAWADHVAVRLFLDGVGAEAKRKRGFRNMVGRGRDKG